MASSRAGRNSHLDPTAATFGNVSAHCPIVVLNVSPYHLRSVHNRETATMLATKRLLSALALALIGTSAAQAADEVVVYSSRIDELIKPVFDAYTKKTGVAVKFITDKEAPLMQRIKAEGANATADLLLTVDARQPLASRADGDPPALHLAGHRRQHPASISCVLPRLDRLEPAGADHRLFH